MKKSFYLICFFFVTLAASAYDGASAVISGYDSSYLASGDRNFGADFSKEKFLVLCYHDIPVKIVDDADEYAVELENFVLQIEFLKSEGFSFISADDVIAASEGRGQLPEKSVLLSFDDAYESFYINVFPLLKIYKIPAMLAVVSSWIEAGELPEYKKRFMTWEQIKEVSESGLVNVASHSFNMHKSVQTNHLGSTAAMYVSRIYDPKSKTYEGGDEYLKRISKDIQDSFSMLSEKDSKVPISIVWPYGRYNGITVKTASQVGFKMMFTLDAGLGNIQRLQAIPRFIMMGNPPIKDFAKMFRKKFVKYPRDKIVHLDIDSVYDPDPEKISHNIDLLIERIYTIKPHAVYLQAFCDSKGDGNIESVYFPNRVLPMKADIFGRIARSLSVRGIAVYAWMPVLSIKLPDENKNKQLRVMEFRDAAFRQSSSWYERFSPFSEEACVLMETLYEDLAAYCSFEGVIFQDDAYLNDFEDFHPDAMKAYLN
ncbi:MAG TPA: poly-beta-1,6-N-acetyl-D-glucosamine N-deacetylase PgaB, partial [Victivallales bacterium]|nr:poly-beta-1,6-N-acetyl-D-glucosamine N-deacetylase PgaB [Victivallales bacterium]